MKQLERLDQIPDGNSSGLPTPTIFPPMGFPDQRCRPRNVYDPVFEVLKRNHGRKLREVMDAEIDISDVIQ
jgi:hypothetical protein